GTTIAIRYDWRTIMRLSHSTGIIHSNAAGTLRILVVAGAALALTACNGDDDSSSVQALPVAKAACGASDRAETGLQGQIPIAERTGGFKGFNCNLQKTAATNASRGDGSWQQFISVRDVAGRTCGYAGRAFLTNQGTVVVDLTDPNRSVETALLTSAATLNPGEGLRTHAGRGLLVTAFYNNGPSTNPATKA